jgi:hypothetical protein
MPATKVGRRAEEGTNIVVASLMRSMVVTTAAIFRGDNRAISLPKVLNAALRLDRSGFLKTLHIRHGHTKEAEISRERLVKYHRSLKRGKIREAVDALAHVRNTFIAQFDLEPNADGRNAIVRDPDRIIRTASIVVGEANVFVLDRRVHGGELRKILRSDANGFVETLRKGF